MARKLGRYDVLGEIGRGGMGSVLRARSPEGRIVAIKVLLKGRVGSDSGRFAREQRLQSELGEADGFVPLLEHGDGPEGPFVVMPLLEGGTLRAKLEAGLFSIDATLELGRALARALGRAHAHGVVHRDLKPENVLFTAEGRPLVADLGLAKHFDKDSPGASRSVELSKTGELRGTAGYMAPEQLEDAKSAGPPADVFALGAILYECLAGRPPFVGETAVELLIDLKLGKREPLGPLRRDAPGWLVAVVERALAQEVSERFRDGAELARALEEGASGGQGARSRSRGSGVATGVRVAVLAAAVLAVAALVGLGVVKRARSGEPSPDPKASSPNPIPNASTTPSATPSSDPGPGATGPLEPKLTASWGDPRGVHPLGVRGAALLPRGRALTAGGDGTLRVWDLATLEDTAVLAGHEGAVNAVAVTPSGARALSAGFDGTVRLWDLAEGRERARVELGAPVETLALSRSGARALVGTRAGELLLFDPGALEKGPLASARAHEGRVTALACSPGSDLVLSAGIEGRVSLWRVGADDRFEALASYHGHEPSEANAVAFARDASGREIGLSGGKDHAVRLLDLERGGETGVYRGDDDVGVLSVLEGGRGFLAGGRDHTVRHWLLGQRDLVSKIQVSASRTMALLGLEGGRFFFGDEDGVLGVLEVDTRDPRPRREGQHRGRVAAIACSRSGELVATGGDDGVARLVDGRTGQERARFEEHLGGIDTVAFTEGDSVLATGSWDHAIVVHDLAKGEGSAPLPSHEGPVQSLVFGPEGELFSGGGDNLVRLWRRQGLALEPAGQKPFPQVHAGPISAVALSPDGKRAFSGGQNGEVVFWNVARCSDIEASPPGPAVSALAFLPDGKEALSTSDDGGVRLWDGRTGKLVREVGHSRGALSGLALLGAKRFATVGRDGALRIWALAGDGAREQACVDLGARRDVPSSVAASGDGRVLFVGTARGVVEKYSIETK